MPTVEARLAAMDQVFDDISEELTRTIKKFKPFNSSHEGYAVLKEEVDELWDAIKTNNLENARTEAVQVAAMAIRYIMDVPTTKEK
jgi:NTP pyrophosphatase (non-canonical NTP hydrolase)